MGKLLLLILVVLIYSAVVHPVMGDQVDALKDLYISLNKPAQLINWSLVGNPCRDSWKGISCSSANIISIQLSGMELNGSLGDNLGGLSAVTHLNLSHNKIVGELPYALPPTLIKLDLSYNNIKGPLPVSFKNLTSLSELYLQHNFFSGSLDMLEMLSLKYLNVEINHFSGAVSEIILNIPHLRMAGNNFDDGVKLPVENGRHKNATFASPSPKKPKESKFSLAAVLVGLIAFTLGLAVLVVFVIYLYFFLVVLGKIH